MSQELDGGALTLLILIGYLYWALCHWMSSPPPTDSGAVKARASGPDLPFPKRISRARPKGGDRPLWAVPAEPGSAAAEALWTVRAADRTFDAARFLQGAVAAYETILAAFADGDVRALADLTAAEVYDPFVAAIAARDEQPERTEWRLLAIDAAKVVDAVVSDGAARITVRFCSRFATCRRNGSGEALEGTENGSVSVTDEWAFARKLRSGDPNWRLVATASA
jgi:predicted lipid-binding transport protein (Tim44 family)